MINYNKITLNKNSKEHLYIQLFKSLKAMISAHEILPNEKLPPIREIARELDVNNITIVNAYKLLESEKLVYKKIGSGTYVYPEIKGHVSNNDDSESFINITPSNTLLDENTINFASGTPSNKFFPVEELKTLLNEVLDRDLGDAFGYQDTRGYYPLRESITEFLDFTNIKTDTACVQIISGAQQGLDIVSKAILNHGDTIIIEGPTYTGAIATFKNRGVRILELPITDDGVNLLKLKEYIFNYKPKLFYTMPNFQNPTGFTYPLEQKNEIIELSNKHNFVIVEDDYASELNFEDVENSTLKSLDIYDKVIYIKSFSKIFMPGLRLGFMVTPNIIKDKILYAKHTTDISTSGLIQRSFDLFLRKKLYIKQYNRMLEEYKKKYLATKESIEKYMPKEVKCRIPGGGINFWFTLPSGLSSRELYEKSKAMGVLIVSGDTFYSKKSESNEFRISISSLEESEIEIGIRILSSVIRDMLKETSVIDKSFNPIL